MNIMIELHGRVIPKKNSRVNTRDGRSFPSKQYKEWHDDAMKQLMGIKKQELEYPVYVGIVFTFGDKRKNDIDNRITSIMDLLVDKGIIQDDSYACVDRVSGCARYEKNTWETTIMIQSCGKPEEKN
jgi:Holliday junction resolvase RusA-like endonuclease